MFHGNVRFLSFSLCKSYSNYVLATLWGHCVPQPINGMVTNSALLWFTLCATQNKQRTKSDGCKNHAEQNILKRSRKQLVALCVLAHCIAENRRSAHIKRVWSTANNSIQLEPFDRTFASITLRINTKHFVESWNGFKVAFVFRWFSYSTKSVATVSFALNKHNYCI